jgi:tRNA nucleotidyltransferase/poly(A) polymerase
MADISSSASRTAARFKAVERLMSRLVPERQRHFALKVVRKLRDAGFEAVWAGGCVRDMLLKRQPKDYDVATDAKPRQIRQVFSRRRTLAIGAAFGVITVLGPKGAGQIEVATFRRDDTYSDGRHPDSVAFSSAREDASRRDFTINGVFYDPIDGQYIDYVGGQEDLQRRVIRAIGDPRERFGEDKLRMLRAVRFAATLDFGLDPATRDAVRQMAGELPVVSPERIAAEMQRLLTDARRARGIRLLIQTGLAEVVLPEIVPQDDRKQRQLEYALSVLDRLKDPGFPLALAALVCAMVDAAATEDVCRRWRLSNKDTDRAGWLVENREALRGARQMRWSALQPVLIHDGIEDLLALHEAEAAGGVAQPDDAAYCRRQLQRPPEELDPPPLLTGDDLIRHGVPRGPQYRTLLKQVRAAQLDGEIYTTADALNLVDRLLERDA